MTDHNYAFTALVVEDMPELAEVMKFTLQRLGIEPVIADSGEMALEYLSQGIPDLILLDLGLPGMSGWDVLKQIHAAYGRHAIPVIVTTAYSDKVNRMIGRLQYVNDYIIKPFQPKELMDSVVEVLELNKYAHL